MRFAINPSAARLLIDDHRVGWFGNVLALTPGEHRVSIDVPDSRCCEPLERTVVIEPPADDHAPQLVSIQLTMRPADVTLVNAPQGATVRCDELNLQVAPGELATTMLPAAAWDVRCRFRYRDGRFAQQQSVRLRAGEVNAIRWPE